MYITYKTQSTYKQQVFDFSALYNNYGQYQQVYETIPGSNITVNVPNDKAVDLFNKYNLADRIPRLETLAELGKTVPIEYERFYIPKKTGGLREINAPKPLLANHLRVIKDTLEIEFMGLAHNSAFAYVKGRSTVDAVKIHQANNSNWFLKIDIKKFFDNCNKTFIISQLKQVFPFGLLDEKLLDDLITPGILNDGLPQGTPLSPFLTNMIMVPIDYAIQDLLGTYKQYFIYTRYADDIIISSKYDFNWQQLQEDIEKILSDLTPFKINKAKTRYGSKSGRNWNLGLMLNKDNNITIGYKKKERCRAMIYQFMSDYKNGIEWNKEEIQIMLGLISYYKMVEPDYFSNLIAKYNKKFNLNFNEITKL